MKQINILILSDTHGRADRIREALSRQSMPPDYILHLGDGIADIERCDTGNATVLCVRGNCDTVNDGTPDERVLSVGNIKIMMMHGHRFGVKSSLEYALEHAAEAGADILLHGHTHIQHETLYSADTSVGVARLEKPINVFNPGSAGGLFSATFGTLTIRDGVALFGTGRL